MTAGLAGLASRLGTDQRGGAFFGPRPSSEVGSYAAELAWNRMDLGFPFSEDDVLR